MYFILLSVLRTVRITAILAVTHAATVPVIDQLCHTATHGKIGSVKISVSTQQAFMDVSTVAGVIQHARLSTLTREPVHAF